MDLFQMIGKFHPLILHLPIGIFVFTFLLEILARFKKVKHFDEAISIGLLSGFGFAMISCITGLILADNGGYNADAVSTHKWVGICMTFASIIIYFFHKKKLNGASSIYYFPSFIGLILLLIYTGHKGANLTHGEGFLWNEEEEEIQLENIDEAIAFEKVIMPIFKNRCNSCHNPSKAKGALIMTNKEGLMKGGENGVVIVAGNIAESKIIERIHLPLSEKEHMPPKSKKQLTEDEVTLLEWWIKEGASFDAPIGDITQTDQVKTILAKYKEIKSSTKKSKVRPASENSIKALLADGIDVQELAINNPLLSVDISHEVDLDKSAVKKIRKVKDQLSILNAGFSNIDDQMLSFISDCKNLQNLQLQKTNITDRTINNLKGLQQLQILNLYGTKVGDEIFDVIKKLPALKTVYLWQTNVTDVFIDSLQKEKPLLEINYKIDEDIFGSASLKPPLIIAEKDLFKDTLSIELKLNFRNVRLYYTLDGSEPDSLSALYEQPILIDKTTMIKAKSYKDGWGKSDVSERQFVRSKYDVKEITLNNNPSDKYRGEGAKTLTNFIKGSQQFTDGNWIGYEGKHFTATLDLGESVDVESVTVSALESTGAWIFYPKGLKIWTSEDGSNFKLQKETSYITATASEPPSIKNISESFDQTKARFVRVKVESNLKNPDWHPNPGGNSWVFVDEIVVN